MVKNNLAKIVAETKIKQMKWRLRRILGNMARISKDKEHVNVLNSDILSTEERVFFVPE